MNRENTEKLFNSFPQLYRGRALPLTQNLMGFGFECADGWYDLLYHLSHQITDYAAQAGLDPMAVQVKEKFGGLRFYLDAADERIYAMIDAAEVESYRTCEVCGRPGVLRVTQGGWYKTTCDVHAMPDSRPEAAMDGP
jgi:ribosomal protein L37AE/L43A